MLSGFELTTPTSGVSSHISYLYLYNCLSVLFKYLDHGLNGNKYSPEKERFCHGVFYEKDARNNIVPLVKSAFELVHTKQNKKPFIFVGCATY